MKKLTLTAAAAAIVLAFGLAGCTATAGSSAPEPPALSDPSFAPEPEVAEEPATDDLDMILGFGEAMTWVDGVSISVSQPVAFTPTEYAAGADQANNVVFTLVLTNGTDKPLDPFVYPTLSSGGVEASAIFDTGNAVGELSLGPSTSILPGQTIQWLAAYSIADPASITFEVSPGFAYESAIFTNIP